MKRILATGTALLVGVEALSAWLRPGDTGVALGVALAVALGTTVWAGFAGLRLTAPNRDTRDD